MRYKRFYWLVGRDLFIVCCSEVSRNEQVVRAEKALVKEYVEKKEWNKISHSRDSVKFIGEHIF